MSCLVGNKSKQNLLCLRVGSNKDNRILFHVVYASPYRYFFKAQISPHIAESFLN